MSRKVPALGVSEGLVQTTVQPEVEAESEQFSQADLPENRLLEDDSDGHADVLDQAIQLQAKAKVALIRKLMTQLETDYIQTILEFGLREIGDRHRRGIPTAAGSHQTRLVLKKDYSYQERGLNDPTQYYVYLRRRKPKLDRYVGTLFYIPNGCTLSYFLDAEGRIVFNPPHNVFQLTDSTNASVVQVVRLLHLEPPPPDYTFTKQQNDTPAIYLHLEYLDPKTYQPITTQAHPFPACMHEGGRLDRYRWEVSAVTSPPELSPSLEHNSPAIPDFAPEPELTTFPAPFEPAAAQPPRSPIAPPLDRVDDPVPSPRRILELPATKPLIFYLANPKDADAVLKRMRLWVTWSEKAMPHSRWEIVQDGAVYTLMNAHFKRCILKFSRDLASVTLENALPVVMKWFHDLSLAVSQSHNQRQYSAAQLKQAHSLFVDMSLPQKDAIALLKKLFGVGFSKTES